MRKSIVTVADFCDRLLAARRRTACAVRSSQPMQDEVHFSMLTKAETRKATNRCNVSHGGGATYVAGIAGGLKSRLKR